MGSASFPRRVLVPHPPVRGEEGCSPKTAQAEGRWRERVFVLSLFRLLSWGKLPALKVKLLPLHLYYILANSWKETKRIGDLISQFRHML